MGVQANGTLLIPRHSKPTRQRLFHYDCFPSFSTRKLRLFDPIIRSIRQLCNAAKCQFKRALTTNLGCLGLAFSCIIEYCGRCGVDIHLGNSCSSGQRAIGLGDYYTARRGKSWNLHDPHAWLSKTQVSIKSKAEDGSCCSPYQLPIPILSSGSQCGSW